MQKLLTLNLIGQKGLNTDIPPWDLPPEFLTFGINFRISGSSIQTLGGYADWAKPDTQIFAGRMLHIGATSGDYWLIMARGAIYAFDGETFTDVSSTIGYPGIGLDDELLWTGCMLGQIPIVNNPQAHPEYWSPQSPGQIMQPLQFDAANTWADMGYTMKIMRSHKNFLFALNLQEGIDEQQDAYRWSHPADINGLPFSWDETDPSSLAGKAALGGDGGIIIDGKSLRDAFCIYSENSIDLLDYTGDEFVWRRRELSTTTGLLSKDCIIEVKGRHFLIADGDILMNDGNTLQSLMHNRIRRRFNARMNVDFYNRSYAVRNNVHKEIWFCVPEEDAQYPNIAYIYNWKDDSWAIRDIPESTFLAYGPQAAPTESWDEWFGTWDSGKGIWGARTRTPLDDTIVGIVAADSSLKIMDAQDSTDAGAIGTRIERVDFPLGGQRQVTSISRVYPHIEGTEPVRIQFGSQDYPGGPVRWKPGVDFTPNIDRKVDIRTTGELHCWRIESLGVGHWTFSGMDIEYTESGVR